MASLRSASYHTLLLLTVAALGAVGCGKPTAPPPGADPSTANPPAVEVGDESKPAETPTTPPAGETPPPAEGESK